MTTIDIKTPIWNTRSVGIAEDKILTSPLSAIRILYTLQDGSRLYPHTYYIEREKALAYPIQTIRGVRLRIVPIRDLMVLKEVV
jgi:hypothetical protein